MKQTGMCFLIKPYQDPYIPQDDGFVDSCSCRRPVTLDRAHCSDRGVGSAGDSQSYREKGGGAVLPLRAHRPDPHSTPTAFTDGQFFSF